MTGEVPMAAKQVEALLAQRGGPAPIDIVWAGQVATRQSDPVLAVDYAERVLADQRAKPYDILSAGTLILSATSPYSQPYASAWQQIEAVARDPKNPASLDALVLLGREGVLPPTPATGGSASLSLDSPGRRSPGDDGTLLPPPTPATQGAAVSSPPPATQSADTVSPNLAATRPPARGGV